MARKTKENSSNPGDDGIKNQLVERVRLTIPRKKAIIEEISIRAQEIRSRDSKAKLCFTIDRVSSYSQEDGTSLAFQNEHGMATAEREEYTIVYNFTFVESASKEKRPWFHFMLQCALQALKEGDRIYFKDTTRAARNLADIDTINKLRQQGLEFCFYSAGMLLKKDTHPGTVLSFLLQSVIGIGEADTISYRVKNGQQQKLSWGTKPGKPCWGFVREKARQMFVINTAVAAQLRYIFDTFDFGDYDLDQMVEHLNKKGIRNQHGKPWTKGNLWKLLRRHEYHGEFRWHDEVHRAHYDKEGNNIHPFGLEPEIYYSKDRYVQRLERLSSKRSGGVVGKQKVDKPFKGMVRCAHCPDGFNTLSIKSSKGRHGGKYGVWRYFSHKCKGKGKGTVNVRQEVIFDLIDQSIGQLKYTPDFAEKVKTIFETPLANTANLVKSDLNYINTRQADLVAAEKKMYKEFATDLRANKDLVMEAIEEIRGEFNALEAEKKVLLQSDDEATDIILDTIDALKILPQKYLSSKCYEKKSELLNEMLLAVKFDGESVNLIWKDPYSILASDDFFKDFSLAQGLDPNDPEPQGPRARKPRTSRKTSPNKSLGVATRPPRRDRGDRNPPARGCVRGAAVPTSRKP